tara:strand:+ start:9460 stop:10248 length:789 start_codon:yes stop_codon:yes gene_type:complete
MNLIADEQLKYYHENGFVVIKNLLDAEYCDMFYKTIRQHADIHFSAIMNPDRFEFLIAQSFENTDNLLSLNDKVSCVEKILKTSKMCRDLLKNKKISKILSTIQGNEVKGLMSQMLFKEAKSKYCSQAWQPHQDNAYPKNKNGQYLTINLFLKDAFKKNGSLYAYKGSHKSGLFENIEVPSYREKIGTNPGNIISDVYLNNFEKIDLEFDKGDMLVLHGNCIHGSYPNYSNFSRPLFSCSYITKGEDFIAGKNAQRKIIDLN